LMLGGLVQGITVHGRAYGGGWFDWLTPFSMTTALALVVGYALLGATWLIWKTDGYVQNRAYRFAWSLMLAFTAAIAVISLWTPFLNPHFLARWFSWPAILYVAPVPLLALTAIVRLMLAVHDRKHAEPFFATITLFIFCYVGLGISLFPNIVPPSVSIWDAAAPDKSLAFLLVGASVLIPIILAYTAYSYWVFRGKVTPDGGYH